MSKLETWSDFVSNRPTKWSIHLLGDLFTHRKEKGYDGLKLLAVTGNGGVVKRDTLDRRDTSNVDKSKYLRVCVGDIAYNTMRMWQGVSGLSRYEGLVSPAYTVCSSRKELIESEYSQHLFKLPLLITQFHRYSQGLVDDTLNLKFHHFSEIDVLLPPLPEQQQIASILTSVDQVIEKTQSQINKLQDLKKGTMNELLTRGIGHTEFKDSPVGRIPKGWEIVSIDDVSSKVVDGPHKTPTYVNSGIPFVTVKNMITGKLDFSNLKSITELDHQKFVKRGKAEVGDLLYSKDGSIGQTCVIETDRPFSYFVSVALIKLVKDVVSPYFVNFALQSEKTRVQVLLMSEGSGLKHMVLRSIKSLKIPLPPKCEQNEIVSILSSIDTHIEEKQQKLQQTQSLKRSLMQDLLTGKVRVTVH